MGEIAAEKGKKGGKNGNGNGDDGKEKVVLKVDLNCQGCVVKILKYVRAFQGVEEAKVEKEANKLTVEGKMDAARLREMLQAKTKKKVEIVTLPPPPPQKQQPQQKKKKEEEEAAEKDGKSVDNAGKEKKSGDKKPKELPVATVVIKLGGLDCQGCVAKINKIISKTAGVQDFTVDKDKEVATVKGTVDPKALADNLREKMRRSVEIVPQKKEKDDKEKDKDKDKEKEKEKEGGGKKKKGKTEEKVEGGGRMEYYGPPPQTQPGYENRAAAAAMGEYSYGLMYGEQQQQQVHAPQLFSDENPNACSVM